MTCPIIFGNQNCCINASSITYNDSGLWPETVRATRGPQSREQKVIFYFLHTALFPALLFFCPPLLFLSSPSMTSVKRTSFPASSHSTRKRRRVSRKQAMWTVSTDSPATQSGTTARCWARIGHQVIKTEVGTSPLGTTGIRSLFRHNNNRFCASEYRI